jgi:hypothetical protein
MIETWAWCQNVLSQPLVMPKFTLNSDSPWQLSIEFREITIETCCTLTHMGTKSWTWGSDQFSVNLRGKPTKSSFPCTGCPLFHIFDASRSWVEHDLNGKPTKSSSESTLSRHAFHCRLSDLASTRLPLCEFHDGVLAICAKVLTGCSAFTFLPTFPLILTVILTCYSRSPINVRVGWWRWVPQKSSNSSGCWRGGLE